MRCVGLFHVVSCKIRARAGFKILAIGRLGHRLEAMMTTNQANPTKGCAVYVTTYQALAADTRKVNAKEFRRKRYLLVLDEPHHLEEGGLWHTAIQPLYDRAVLRVLMSGTFDRGEGTPIAFMPYANTAQGDRIDWGHTESRAVIRYTLADALREQACIDTDGALRELPSDMVGYSGNRASC